MYRYGVGVEKDYTEAVKWYRKAAEQERAWAQYGLGVMYESGLGVTKDQSKAIELYRKAAAQGNEPAQAGLERLGVN